MKFKRGRMAVGRSRIPSNSIPQSLCPDPVTNLAEMAAIKARDAAEAYFALQSFDCAIMQAKVAQEFNPNLPGMDDYITAYQVHSAVSARKNWYDVLGIPKNLVANSETIKKQYKRMALSLHPDKNGSIAADGAFKYVKAAWDLLFDPAKKEAYDKYLRRRFQGAHGSNNRRSGSSSSAGGCRPAQCKRAGPGANTSGGDGSFFKKTIKIVRKSSPGQKASVMMISVCRVA